MKNIKIFISYYKPERRLFFMDMLAASVIALLDLVFPITTRLFMKDFIPNRNMQAVFIWGGVLVVLYLIRLMCQYFVQYYGHVVGVNMESQMRKDLFTHLQTLDFRF